MKLISQYSGLLKSLRKIILSTKQKLKDQKIQKDEQIFQFYETQIFSCLGLLIQIINYLIAKMNGEQIEKSEFLKNLIYFRQIHKKLLPIKQILVPQVETLLSQIQNNKNQENKNDNFKPNLKLDNVTSKSIKTKTQNDGIKNMSIQIKQDDKDKKRMKKLQKTGYIKKIEEEIDDQPEEKDLIDKQIQKLEERKKYEENQFTRFMETKKDKKDTIRVQKRFEKNPLNDFTQENDLKNYFSKEEQVQKKRIKKNKKIRKKYKRQLIM